MRITLPVLAALLAVAVLAAPARATTLVNDPDHPFTAADFGKAKLWLSRSHVPTAPGTYVLSRGLPFDRVSWVSAAGDHRVWLTKMDRYSLMHEMGHEAQFYLYYPLQLALVQNIMGMGGQPWDGPAGFVYTPMEVGADAYAECAMHQTWPGAWWEHKITTYDFEAGPKNFARICAVYRTA